MSDERAVSAESSIGFSSTVEISVRNYFSYQHYFSARYFSALCSKREKDLIDNATPLDPRHRAAAIGSVQASVGFLEAYINELYQNAHDGTHSRLSPLPLPVITLMGGLWAATEVDNRQVRTLEKYNLVLRMAEKPLLALGENPFQSAKKLIGLRNFLTHYKPDDISLANPHQLERELKGLFDPNALMAGQGNPWFPDHAIGAGMSRWAVATAENFVDEFNSRLGLLLDYKARISDDDGSDSISL